MHQRAYVEILSTWEVWRALKGLELHSAAPRATLTPLSCSPNFPRAQYLDIRTLMHELIVKWRLCDVPGLKSVCKAWSTENAAWVHSLSPIPLDRSASWSAAMLRSGTSSVLWTKQQSQLQSTISKPTHLPKWPFFFFFFATCWETNSILWKYRQRGFIWMVTPWDSVHRFKI